MAIVQTSLAEEILSRQERAVLRGIYRASQLADALSSLNKLCLVLANASDDSAPTSGKPTSRPYSDTSTNKLGDYLAKSIVLALAATKVPATSSEVKKSQSAEKA